MRTPFFAFLIVGTCVTAVYPFQEALAADKDPFFYFLEAEVLGGYSKIPGRDGKVTTNDRWLVSPNFKLNETLTWLNVYDGAYSREVQVAQQEEGGRQISRSQSHSLTTALKWQINDRWSLRPTFFSDWIYVNDTTEEKFGEGLYDYEDRGGGIEAAYLAQKSENIQDEWRLGARLFRREYPNYQSLLSLFDPNNNVETNEKDYDGYKFNLSRDYSTRAAWSWGLEGIFLYKDFVDKKTINANGIRTSSTREDYLSYLNGYVSHPLAAGFVARIDVQGAANFSNLDFYDTHNTLTLAGDDFIEDYFDYYSLTAKPTLLWQKEFSKTRVLTLSASYALSYLQYAGRRAQNPLGIYGDDKQHDFTHIFSTRAAFSLAPHVSWVFSFQYTIADSNQEFEQFYLYNYDLWSALTGFSFRY